MKTNEGNVFWTNGFKTVRSQSCPGDGWYRGIHAESSKNRSGNAKGSRWWNDGKTMIRSQDCPGEGWNLGRLDSVNESNRERFKKNNPSKGLLWWNNGIEMTRAKTSPGEGWERGKLKK